MVYNAAMREPALILASRSPRRGQLLRAAGWPFLQLEPAFVDPPQPDHADPLALAPALALAKAQSLREAWAQSPGTAAAASWFAEQRRHNRRVLILGADTIVVAPDGRLLGQPVHLADARAMLRCLMGATHQVVTGAALIEISDFEGRESREAASTPITLVDVAQVRVGSVSEVELEKYLASGDWAGKAGAYNLAELETRWSFTVTGDPTTVVGLPMQRLTEALRNLSAGSATPGHPR